MSTDQPLQRPDAIFRNVLSIYSPMAMLAGMQLDLFTPLKDGPMTATELAASVNVTPGRLEVLLYSLVRADLLTVQGGRFANTDEANGFLVRGRPGYLGGSHELYSDLWTNLLKIAGSVQADAPLGKHDFAAMSDAELGAFLRGLHAGALATGAQISRRPGFLSFKTLLDVGGGSGGVSIAACNANAGLRATIAELPRIAPFAIASAAEAGLSHRIRIVTHDVVSLAPDGQFDEVVLRFFIQVLGKEAARRALVNVAEAMRPGGEIIVIAHLLENDRLSPPQAMGQSLVMLTIYEEGQAYTEAEYRDWLANAGFEDIRLELGAAPGGASIMTARKK
jgi:hypothetical protein